MLRRAQRNGPCRRLPLIALAALAVASSAHALELPEPPGTVSVLTGAGVSMSDESAAWPFARVSVETPVFVGRSAFGRMNIDVTFLGLPGDTLDLQDVATYKALEFSAGYKWRIGASDDGASSTYVTGRAAFATRVLPADPAPRDRYARVYGAGIRAEHREAGVITRAVEALYGRSEIASPEMHYGQLMVSGHVRVVTAKGVALIVGGDAHLNIGKSVARGARDVARIWLALSPA
jgi:hypothetical protein